MSKTEEELYIEWKNSKSFDSFEMFCYQQGKVDAINEYKDKLWEDISTRYKNDINILGYLSSAHLLRDVHNAICYFAKQLKESK